MCVCLLSSALVLGFFYFSLNTFGPYLVCTVPTSLILGGSNPIDINTSAPHLSQVTIKGCLISVPRVDLGVKILTCNPGGLNINPL